MNRLRALVLLVALTLLSLSCGSGSGSSRQLQSIAISQVANGQQIQFIATGTFSAPPTTVTPLPVNWSLGLLAPPPGENLQYTLTTQPYQFDCTGQGPMQVSTLAPADPNAPTTGSLPFAQMVTAAAPFSCP